MKLVAFEWLKTFGARAMDIEEFEDLVDRLGEDLTKWPVAARQAGEALLIELREARDILEESRALRQAFSPRETDRAPPDLADRIVRRALSPAGHPSMAPAQVNCPAAVARFQFAAALLLPLCFAAGFVLSLVPIGSRTSDSQIEVPAFFQACCGGGWNVRRDD